MASVNKVILVGGLCRDPELRSMPDGRSVVNLSIATTDRWSDKQTGEKRESKEFHRATATGQPADFAAQYLAKGSQVYIEGKLKTRKWTDPQGNERQATEIRVDVLTPVGAKGERE